MSWFIRTTDSLIVVCVVKALNANVMLYNTLRDVQIWTQLTWI